MALRIPEASVQKYTTMVRQCLLGFAFLWFALTSPAWSIGLLTPILSSATPQIVPGQTPDQVISSLGDPDQIVDFGKRVVYVYGNRKIVFANGRVTDAGAGGGRAAKQTPPHGQKREIDQTVAARPTCQAPDGEPVRNEIHGQIQIESGSGSFVAISPRNRDIWVTPGSNLSGSVKLRVVNGGSGGVAAPLIGSASWGDPSRTFWTVSQWIHSGTTDLSTEIKSVAPKGAGTYHIVFAMQLEKSSADVASATDWTIHRDKWDDGNDIARMSPKQIRQAQREGCTTDKWLTANGYELTAVPADAITVHVGMRAANNRSIPK